MFQYIARRLLIMIPTLLGISLVTLTLIHLAPGDPVEMQLEGAIGKGTISPEEIEALRRTFYLHLPVFLNSSPEDATTVNAELVEDLTSPDEAKRERAARRLPVRGTVALEAVVAVLPGASRPVQESILAGLAPIAARMGLEQELASSPDKVAFWQAQIKALEALPEDAAEQAVTRLTSTPGQPSPETLRRLDSLALPALFSRVREIDPADRAAEALTAELSRITGVDLTVHEGDSLEQRARLLDDWRRWWAPRRADMVRFTGLEKTTAVFTETQYFKWLSRLVVFDFDRSSRDNVPIRQKLRERFKVTLTLAMLSLMVSYLVAIPIGVYSAVRQYSLADRTLTVLLFMFYSLPSFWVAMLLQQYVCGAGEGSVDWFPLVGLYSADWSEMGFLEKIGDVAWHLVLPVSVLAYRSFASLSRFQRVGMLEIIRQDYIRTARAKGLPERLVIMKHALRNSVLPIVTLLGIHVPALMGGAVIVESIFQINGMGLETLEAIRTRDMNWIMASVTVSALLTMAGILVSDVLYALIDPRIQVGSKGGT